MITSTAKQTNYPEEETMMMKKLMSKLFGKKEVTIEEAMVEQATKIASVLAQLDALNGKAGN